MQLDNRDVSLGEVFLLISTHMFRNTNFLRIPGRIEFGNVIKDVVTHDVPEGSTLTDLLLEVWQSVRGVGRLPLEAQTPRGLALFALGASHQELLELHELYDDLTNEDFHALLDILLSDKKASFKDALNAVL